MAGSKSSNPPKTRKRVEAETPSSTSQTLKRSKSGSAFTRCEDCNKDVAMALIDFHDCSLDAKIKMNLEAQAVEVTKKPPPPPKKQNKAGGTTTKPEKSRRLVKKGNGRKKPPTAFFVFMDDFRKTFKAENPECKSVATVAKEGGEKWKSLTEEEKKVYVDKAKELKAEYEKACEADKEVKEEEETEKVVDEELEDEIEDDVEKVEDEGGEEKEVVVKEEKSEVVDDADE